MQQKLKPRLNLLLTNKGKNLKKDGKPLPLPA